MHQYSAKYFVQQCQPVGWERRGVANNHPFSVRALAYVIAGHVRHHFQVLDTRYGG